MQLSFQAEVVVYRVLVVVTGWQKAWQSSCRVLVVVRGGVREIFSRADFVQS